LFKLLISVNILHQGFNLCYNQRAEKEFFLMLELPHTLVGAAIATKIPNPLIALPLALASHFVLDLIPHWNPSLYTETKKHGQPSRKSTQIVFWDSLLSLGSGFLIASLVLPDVNHFFIIVLACFLAVSPDLIEAPFFFFNYRPKFIKKIIFFQRRYQGRASKIPGLLIQLAVIILALIIVLI